MPEIFKGGNIGTNFHSFFIEENSLFALKMLIYYFIRFLVFINSGI